jgi:hypothetical protein
MIALELFVTYHGPKVAIMKYLEMQQLAKMDLLWTTLLNVSLV